MVSYFDKGLRRRDVVDVPCYMVLKYIKYIHFYCIAIIISVYSTHEIKESIKNITNHESYSL